ncbi:MAG TPA: hypothetical protein PLH37_01780 [bacterium]|nr:hypothetical protein [bacterium]
MLKKNITEYALKLIKICPVCGMNYKIENINAVEENAEDFLVCFSCSACQSSLLSRVMSMPFGLVGSAILTDLKVEEIDKFKDSEPVTANDVLNIYERLEFGRGRKE